MQRAQNRNAPHIETPWKQVAHCRFGAIKMSNPNNTSAFSNLFLQKMAHWRAAGVKFFFAPKIYQKKFFYFFFRKKILGHLHRPFFFFQSATCLLSFSHFFSYRFDAMARFLAKNTCLRQWRNGASAHATQKIFSMAHFSPPLRLGFSDVRKR